MSSLLFATYNSHGSGTDRIEYMKEILQVTDILLIQEHWLLDSRISSLEDNINDVHVHGMSGMLESYMYICLVIQCMIRIINHNIMKCFMK